MFHDTIEFTHVDKGELFKIKVCPKLYADWDQHEFTGTYAVYIDGKEIEVSGHNGFYLCKKKLLPGLLELLKEKIEKKIKAENNGNTSFS